MINLKTGFFAAKSFVKSNSPAILTAFGITGTATTAYLAGVASYRAAKRLEELPPIESKRELVVEVWDLYIPAGISGVATIACIFASNHVSSKRTAAAYSLLAVSEKVFEEYRNEVIKEIGAKKEKSVRDHVAETRVHNNPMGNLIIADPDGVLCCELLTGRYFTGDIEKIRRAVNEVNAKVLREDYAVLGEFYYILNLPHTSNSGSVGWTSDKLLEVDFTSILTEGGKPCLAFDYNYLKPL